jgi:hypothetical protein
MASVRPRPLRHALVAGAVAALALGTSARPAAAEDEQAARIERRQAEKPNFMLDLGTWGRPGAVTAETVLRDAPRFESTVNVEGQAPRDPNEAMAEWWVHFDLPQGAIYGQNTTYRPGTPVNSVNILPLVDWLAKKIKDRKNRD